MATKLARLQSLKQRSGTALILTTMCIVILFAFGATVLRLATNRLATVSQSSSWQKAYNMAEAGVDIARSILMRAQEDYTVWDTTIYRDSNGATYKWSPTEPNEWPKRLVVTMPRTADNGLDSKVRLEIQKPSGSGTINATATSVSTIAYIVRSFGTVDIPGPIRLSRDPVEVNLRKVNWMNDWRTGEQITANGKDPSVTRGLEVVLRGITPFSAAILADSTIEVKKGKAKLVDSWNSKASDAKERVYLKPGDDKYKGAMDIGNIAANGVTDKKKKTKNVIRLENTVIWGDVYLPKPTDLIIKPTPKKLTDVIKGGDIIDNFYMKLDPIPSRSGLPSWTTLTGLYAAKPGSLKTAPLFLDSSADPANPTKYKFTELHLHEGDSIVVKPATNSDGVVQPKGYIDIWVSNSLRLHKGGNLRLGEGVSANIYVDKCIHIEKGKDGPSSGIVYADFKTDGQGRLLKDKIGKYDFTPYSVADAQSKGIAHAEQLAIIGTPTKKKKRSHAKFSAEFLGTVYAPRHDFTLKYKDDSYSNIYGSLVGRKFKIEGLTKVHYDEALREVGPLTDYEPVSMVEDWYDRSAGK